jgi:small subunit ribosomal protein S6
MKNRYEGLLVLNQKGNDDTVKDIIERLEGEFEKEGAKVEQVQKMDRRQFSYVAGHIDSGFYVNFVFASEPNIVDRLRAKFKLDADVYRQHYQKLKKLRAKKVAKEKAAK